MQPKNICPLALGMVFLLSFCTPARSLATNADPAFAVKEVIFSLEQTSKVAPEDVILEVSYFAAPVFMCSDSDSEAPLKPAIGFAPDTVDWLDSIDILTYGWKSGEKVSLSITTPDARVIEYQGNATSINFVDEIYHGYTYRIPLCLPPGNHKFAYQLFPNIDNSPGVYKFVFEGESGRIEKNVIISMSVSPRMRYPYDDDKIVLWGFLPNEHIYLYAFGQTGFIGVVEYDVGNNGALIIKTGNDPLSFCAVGEISGIVDLDGTSNCLKK